MIIDYDNIDEWGPDLTKALRHHLPNSIEQAFVAEKPMYIEDARDLLFDLAGREPIIDGTLDWLRSGHIVGYHGSRLTAEETASVRSIGLVPLQSETRRQRIIQALSSHSKWPEVADRLDGALHSHGPGGVAGKREGQVHLTLSKGGLTKSYSHYLEYGSEFDWQVAHDLLGKEGQELLAMHGESTLIRVAVPGEIALNAAHPYFSVEDLRNRGDVPNVAGDFLSAWSFRLTRPTFQPSTLRTDCGLIVYGVVSPKWIVGVERWKS